MRIPHTVPRNVFQAYRCSLETTQLPSEVNRTLRAEDTEWDRERVPDLKTLALQVCAANYHENPDLELSNEDRELLIELLPVDLPFETAIRTVPEEFYWLRAANHRWERNNPEQHGCSWRRLYCERHVAEYLERLEPDFFESRLAECQNLLGLVKDHVEILTLRSLQPTRKRRSLHGEEECNPLGEEEEEPHHIPLSGILAQLPRLTEIDLRFGLIYMHDGFEWRDFRFSVEDCLSLGEGLKSCASLKKFRLTRSNLDQPRLAAILQGAVVNRNITELDFSHCKLSDGGACAIGEFLSMHGALRDLRLSNNGIGPDGIAGIVYGLLKTQDSALRSLDLRLNPLGDEGAVHICALLLRSENLEELNISGCDLNTEAGNCLIDVLGSGHLKLKSLRLDISNNNFGEEVGNAFNRILESSPCIVALDARMCGFPQESRCFFRRGRTE